MTARLVTRLAGYRVLVQLVPSGSGPLIYAGELREAGGPVRRWRFGVETVQPRAQHYPVALGAHTANGLGALLTVLEGQAASVRRREV